MSDGLFDFTSFFLLQIMRKVFSRQLYRDIAEEEQARC